MKSLFSILMSCMLITAIQSCKSDTSASDAAGSTSTTAPAKSKNDTKALEGSGAVDISATHQLEQSQIVQEGNVAFGFKTLNALQVYIKSPDNNKIDFTNNEVFAIFAEPTVKETNFKVQSIDLSGEQPVLNVESIITTNTVAEYRPSFVVTVPKKDIKGFPIIRLDGAELSVFLME